MRDRREDAVDSLAEVGEPVLRSAPTDWRVVTDGVEAKHAVRGEWALHLGRGSLRGRRDEWWLTVERDGERVLERARMVVGAGASPWARVTELLDECR